MKRMISTVLILTLAAFTGQAQVPDQYTVKGTSVMVEKYYDDGSVRERGSYKGENVHGQWVSFYPDGSLHIEAQYDNGKKVGKWLVYSQDGEYLYEAIYKDNLLVDTHRWKIEERNLLAGE